jgi:sialic acid synthase SpsE
VLDFVMPAHSAAGPGQTSVFAGRRFTALDPYLIAEIGVNHEGSIERAKRMIDSVARAGGHAAKFQTYKADLLAAKTTSPAYWDTTKEPTKSQHELFQRFDTFGPEQYVELAEHCRQQGIDFMSTPFDLEAVDYLTPLMPLTKVASADLTNIPLLRRIAKTGNPVVMSVGAGSHEEIERALNELTDNGCPSVTLMHCVLNYPTPRDNAQLSQIKVLQERFGDRVAIGYSDHVRPEDDGSMPALETAALFGAVAIEKHFTDDKLGVGNDHYHAMDEQDLARFVARLTMYRELFGDGALHLETQVAAIQNARRRIIARTDLVAGHVITEGDLIALRSNVGIEIFDWDSVVGRRLAKPVSADQPLTWEALG